jgi:hypothetical protein
MIGVKLMMMVLMEVFSNALQKKNVFNNNQCKGPNHGFCQAN